MNRSAEKLEPVAMDETKREGSKLK